MLRPGPLARVDMQEAKAVVIVLSVILLHAAIAVHTALVENTHPLCSGGTRNTLSGSDAHKNKQCWRLCVSEWVCSCAQRLRLGLL